MVITSERNLQGRDNTSERNGMYRGQKAVCKMVISLMDSISNCLLSSSQKPSKCMLLKFLLSRYQGIKISLVVYQELYSDYGSTAV